MNDDFYQQYVVVDSTQQEFVQSPHPLVLRKRLELYGPDGEEVLVLEGVFSDEHGIYPTGTYLFNPEGFCHAPFSDEGCYILVKLRQAPGTNRHHVEIDTRLSGVLLETTQVVFSYTKTLIIPKSFKWLS